jgi:hypothetical protein
VYEIEQWVRVERERDKREGTKRERCKERRTKERTVSLIMTHTLLAFLVSSIICFLFFFLELIVSLIA